MNRNPEVLAEAGNLHIYVLEWIVRCHPDFLLPLSCKTEGSTVRISFHTEGLLTLAEYAGINMAAQPRHAEWIASVLESIREILAKANDHLLDRSLFQLDIHSVWYRAQEALSESQQPVLTCIPVSGAVPKGDLASIAMGLLEMAGEASQADSSDSAMIGLKIAASHGVTALCDYLDSLSSQKTSLDDSPEGQTNPVNSNPAKSSHSGRSRKPAVLIVWIVFTVALVAIPLVLRFGPEPFRIFRSGVSKGYQRTVSGVLGTLAIADFLFLFAPFSPFCLPARQIFLYTTQKGKYRVKLRSFRQEIRASGLVTALASRMGQSGRLGASTSPVAVMSGTERLGFLSEGEPGTLNESQGIRAYLLTAEFLVGRDPDMADLAVPDASIGRVHARINRIEGVFFLTDLGSVNGTCLDGRRLDRHVQTALPDKCRISFAERSFYFIAD